MNLRTSILPTIVVAQFCCTSLWFASNAVMADLLKNFSLESSALGHLTAAVQLGFIGGTFLFALLALADCFSPSKVFCVCALLGSLANLGTLFDHNTLTSLIILRGLTGFFLAGIYPVGMKIAADYFDKGLGKSLGFLVGALVLGTAFPHFLQAFTGTLSWQAVIIITSSLAVVGGGSLWLLVPDGPYHKRAPRLNPTAAFTVFHKPAFRAAAFGYFGHMWELYAFWAFVPVMLQAYKALHPDQIIHISLWSFLIIGIGSLGCIMAGLVAERWGTKRIASLALFFSGICCLIAPLMFLVDSSSLFLVFLLVWGLTVVADSPLFSTLVAKNAPDHNKGTALTIVNCLGYSLTIVSIQLVNSLRESFALSAIMCCLAIGPLFG